MSSSHTSDGRSGHPDEEPGPAAVAKEPGRAPAAESEGGGEEGSSPEWRPLDVLFALADRPEGMPATELARDLGVSPLTLVPTLGELARRSLIRGTVGGSVRLGLGLLALSSQAEQGFQASVIPIAQRLADVYRVTIILAIRQGDYAVNAVVRRPRTDGTPISRVGWRYPLSSPASGVAILASGPRRPDDFEEVIACRQRGYTWSVGGLYDNETTYAVPMLLPDPTAAAICASWEGDRDHREILQALRGAAGYLETEFRRGGSGQG